MAALRTRVALALQLGQVNDGALNSEGAREVTEFAQLLAAVGGEMRLVREVGLRLKVFMLLAQNRGNHPNPTVVDNVIGPLVDELQFLIGVIQKRLTPFTYPFPHARGPLTVADYARSEKASDSKWERAYLDGSAHVERLFALHYRLVGRILPHVEAAETTLDKQ